jgi:hypothetical protein
MGAAYPLNRIVVVPAGDRAKGDRKPGYPVQPFFAEIVCISRDLFRLPGCAQFCNSSSASMHLLIRQPTAFVSPQPRATDQQATRD